MSATAPPLLADCAAATFPCPGCGSEHPWAPEYAGRTARCACGQVLKVPSELAGDPSHSAAAPPPPPPAGASGGGPSDIPAFLRMAHAGGDDTLPPEVEAELAATGKYGEEDLTQLDPRRDTHVPVALLVIGFALTLVDFRFFMSAHPGAAVATAILYVGFKLTVGMILMLGGALLAARFSGVNFGPLGPALLKLAGLCVGPSAVGDLVTSMLGGDGAVAQIGLVVQILLYWGLVSYLFRLDGAQTMAVVGTIAAVKFLTTIAVTSLVMLAVSPAVPSGAGPSGDDDTGPPGLIRPDDDDSDSADGD